MRVLHAALLFGAEPGVAQQMAWEAAAASKLGATWHTSVHHSHCDDPTATTGPARSASSLLARAQLSIGSRRTFYRWLEAVAPDYDAILLRYTPHDPFRTKALKRIATPVASMHHTLEVPELQTGRGVGGHLRAAVEGRFGRESLLLSSAVVGVTAEIVDYELSRIAQLRPSVVYPNGCVINDDDVTRSRSDQRGRVPELLFIAAWFAPWHGLDRLLSDLVNTNEDFVLHLAGRMGPHEESSARSDSRVRVHGGLSASEIESLARTSWLGLSSFALDRNGMTHACTLKVRQYLKHGLSVYAGYEEVFPEAASFYRRGPASFAEILKFAHQRRGVTPESTLAEATPFIDKTPLLRACMTDLERVLT